MERHEKNGLGENMPQGLSPCPAISTWLIQTLITPDFNIKSTKQWYWALDSKLKRPILQNLSFSLAVCYKIQHKLQVFLNSEHLFFKVS